MDYILNWLFNKNIIKKNYVGNDTPSWFITTSV